MAKKVRRTVQVRRVVKGYPLLLAGIKQRIRAAQVRATLSANAELIWLYWEVGRMIAEQQEKRGWGAQVVPRLARDLQNELPDVKGFSERNIGRMIAFFRAYPERSSILPQAVAKLGMGSGNDVMASEEAILPQAVAKLDATNGKAIGQQLVAQLPWGHHILLMEKVKDLGTRAWYMRQTVENGWSRNVLAVQIQARAHAARRGNH